MKKHTIIRNNFCNYAGNAAFAWSFCFAALGIEPKPIKMKIEQLTTEEIRDPAANEGTEKLVVRNYKLSKSGGNVEFCEISGEDDSLKYLGFKVPFYFEDDGDLYGMSISSMNNIFIIPSIRIYSEDRSRGPVSVETFKEDDDLVREFAKMIEDSIKGFQYLALHACDSPNKSESVDGKIKAISRGGVFAIATPYLIARHLDEISADPFFGEILEVRKKDDLITVKLKADIQGTIAKLTIKMKRPDFFEVIEAWLNGNEISIVGSGRIERGFR